MLGVERASPSPLPRVVLYLVVALLAAMLVWAAFGRLDIVAAAGGKPINMLVHGDFGLSVAEMAAVGVRRISIGGALARAAWAAFIAAVGGIAKDGVFTGFANNGRSAPLTAFMQKDLRERGG